MALAVFKVDIDFDLGFFDFVYVICYPKVLGTWNTRDALSIRRPCDVRAMSRAISCNIYMCWDGRFDRID